MNHFKKIFLLFLLLASLSLKSSAQISTTNAAPGNFAVEFDDTKRNHIDHGSVYQSDVTYGNFYCGMWVKPLGGEYAISVSNGGQHLLLFGFGGNATTGYDIHGNVWNSLTSTPTSFATTDRVRHGEWVYVAIWGDTTRLGVSINGVPSHFVNWDGVRRVADAYNTILFVGGSDHQNFKGRIAAWNLFEGNLPYSNPVYTIIRPPLEHFALGEVLNGSTRVAPVLIADYRQGNLQDSGTGFGPNNARHHGFFAETLSSGFAGLSYDFNFTANVNRVNANRPKFVVDPVVYTGKAALQTPISGARIYDSFGGTDSHLGNSSTLSLGTTQVGNATWVSTNYGKLNGKAFTYLYNTSIAIVNDTIADDTTILRKPAGFPLGAGCVYNVVFRYTDDNNYNFLYIDEYGSGYIFTVVAGTQTNLGAFTFGSNWTEARVVATGSTIQTYRDSTLVDTKTVTANQSGLKNGFRLNHPLLRVDEFAVN